MDGESLDFPIAMAFQPIVDVAKRSIYGQEALVRGAKGEAAMEVISRVDLEKAYHFDQTCRKTAIQEAMQLGLKTRLHVNFLPNAVYEPENCIRVTLETAREYGLPLESLTFEVVESEKIADLEHLKNIFDSYKRLGFLTALDDFGEGHSGLNLLAAVQPDLVKIDIKLVRGIDADPVRRAIVRSLVSLGQEMNYTVIGEGVETADESACLVDLGITLQQGYFFARPGFRQLPEPVFG